MAMGTMRAKRQKTHQGRLRSPESAKLPFIEHLYELRKRLFYVMLSIGIWGTLAYFVQQKIVALLLRPAHNQQFIYTSVGGGIDFLFRVCIYTGVVFSIPIIVYHILKYLQPLIKRDAVRFIGWGSVVSGVLAVLGIIFGYFIGLPSALHFLLHQFTTDQIHPLLTIQSYMSFVTLYMLGSALLFQLPLLLVLINRIKPLKPKKLLGMERWVILIAFVLGGIMNPSPRIQDQILLAGPMILAYQVGVFLIWLTNRNVKRPKHVLDLREKDSEARAAREAKFQAARASLRKIAPAPALHPVAPPARIVAAPVRPAHQTPMAMRPTTTTKPAEIPTASRAPVRSHTRRYVNDFMPRRPYRTLDRSPDTSAA